MLSTKEQNLRHPKLAYAYALSHGIKNRTPRNGEYAGPHSTGIVQHALEMAKEYKCKIPCSTKHIVYPSGLIGRQRKVKRNK